VPIVSSKGSLWGVVSVAGPAFRLSDEVLRQIAESTMDAAQRISELTEGRSDQTGLHSVI
jgi:DNA-binding IclR family transcriptional regulator